MEDEEPKEEKKENPKSDKHKIIATTEAKDNFIYKYVYTPPEGKPQQNQKDKESEYWMTRRWKNWKKEHTGNVINALIAGAGIVAAFYANRTFNLTKDANVESSKRDSMSSIRDSTLVSYAKISFDSSNKNFNKSNAAFDAISKSAASSANAANKSYKETKNEFQMGNEPYLQAEPNLVDNGSSARFTITIANYGRMPVKIISGGLRYGILPEGYEASFLDYIDSITGPEHGIEGINKIISYDRPITYPMEVFDGYRYGMIKKTLIVLEGDIIYRNIITNKLKKYTYKIKYTQLKTVETIINENVYINEK